MSQDDTITIAGLVVPYAVHRRWRTKEPATAAHVGAFAAGHAAVGTPVPGAETWYARGQALRKWEDGAAEREAAAAERERRREKDRAENLAYIRKAQDEGRAAWRRGKSLKACPYSFPHKLWKHWRAGWLAEKGEAYRRALMGEQG